MSTSAHDTTAERPRDKLAAGLRQMVDEADQLLRQAAQSGDRQVDEARQKLEHQLRALRLQLDELGDQAGYRARRAVRETDEAVHAHPYGAMGIAAAVGLLVGVLIARR